MQERNYYLKNIQKLLILVLTLVVVLVLFSHFTRFADNQISLKFFVDDPLAFIAKTFIFFGMLISLIFVHNSKEMIKTNKELVKIHILISSMLAMFLVSTNNFIVVILSAVFIIIINYLIISAGKDDLKKTFLDNGRIRDEKTAESSLKYLAVGQLVIVLMFWFCGNFVGMLGKISSCDITNIMEKITFMRYMDSEVIFYMMLLSLSIFGLLCMLIPFHLSLIDAIEGISYPIVFYLITVPKFAALFFLFRFNLLIVDMTSVFKFHWYTVMTFIVLATMLISSLMIFNQNSLKKILFYFSNFLAAIILLGFLSTGSKNYYLIISSSITYILLFSSATYLFLLAGTFCENSNHGDHIDTLKIAFKNSYIKFCAITLLLSFIMLPPFTSSNIIYPIISNLVMKRDFTIGLFGLFCAFNFAVFLLKTSEYLFRKDELIFNVKGNIDIKLSIKQNCLMLGIAIVLLSAGVYGSRGVEVLVRYLRYY
ncbi:MAG: hypothetical protein HQK49_20810 [Oligoflexia bacterium]|nr:hypothetical protein [Oligoflexia bacterium]